MPSRPKARFGDQRLPPRFWIKVEAEARTDGCWVWTACQNKDGYGMYWEGQSRTAHRVAYEALIGPIPEGLEPDHLCRVPACVNPAHMEPVTHLVNVRRGRLADVMRAKAGPNHHRRRKGNRCKYGHEMTPENRYRRPSRPHYIECKTCRRASYSKGKAHA